MAGVLAIDIPLADRAAATAAGLLFLQYFYRPSDKAIVATGLRTTIINIP